MKRLISILIAMSAVTFSIIGMEQPPSLSDLHFGGASVLPFTRWPGSSESWFLLGQEAGGDDEQTYDAFGGKRNPNENHPVLTAAREFSEEAVELLGSPKELKEHIDLDNKNTVAVIAKRSKHYKPHVTYITYFTPEALTHLIDQFHSTRSKATHYKFKEKSELAFIRWGDLAHAITHAKRNKAGKPLPVTVSVEIARSHGRREARKVVLRPLFVKSLSGYFGNYPYTVGHNSKIRFY